jgi:zinc D-Ala-D-Ala dipeptidase
MNSTCSPPGGGIFNCLLPPVHYSLLIAHCSCHPVRIFNIYDLRFMIYYLLLKIARVMLVLFLIFPLNAADLPEGFVYVQDVVPGIQIELRYCTSDNFIGRPVDGYLQPRCIISKRAAFTLKEVQDELKKFGLGLKIFDAYRPQQAVDHFIRWAKVLDDTLTKSIYYPDVRKKDLFKKGYIASKSGHSRGSTVDLTIVDLNSGEELDMGSHWDFLGEISWIDYPALKQQQRANRMLLNIVMQEKGFKPYAQEWWHFTLRIEPFPKQYFNFPVE